MKNKQEDNGFKQAGPYLSLSWQMVITILLGIGIGSYVDSTYGTKPLYFIIFSVFFTIAALYNFIRTVLRLDKEQEIKDKENAK